MKRRDFLKIGIGTVIVGKEFANETAGKPAVVDTNEAVDKSAVADANAPSVSCRDWSVKFKSVTAYITQDTYKTFVNTGRQNQPPEDFLDYLLSGTNLPHCEKVSGMEHRDDGDIVRVRFAGAVFASNTRQHPTDFFAGYEHAKFCLSSPNAKSGTYLVFSKRADQ